MEHKINNNTRIIISIGSNTEQNKNIRQAKELLNKYFHSIKYSSSIWTDPIEIKSEQFLNCIGITETTLDLNEITTILKNIEHLCESSHKEHEMGIVKLDLDLLSYGEVKYHTNDWNRPYIRNLLKEFNINFH